MESASTSAAEVRDLLAYLRTLANPADTVSLRGILNTPRRGIGDKAEQAVATFADRERISFAAALERAQDIPTLATRSLTAIQGFTSMMAGLRELAESGVSAAEVAETVLARTGYVESLDAEGEIEAEGRRENLAELVAVAREFEAGTPGGGLAAFLEQVSLVADTDALPDDPEDGGVVTLMTLHSAKGLEFPVVFLTGMEDGVFPHIRSLGDTKEMEEERRLAYVGITRAEQRLYLSHSRVRSAWGTPSQNPPSRFLARDPGRPHRLAWACRPDAIGDAGQPGDGDRSPRGYRATADPGAGHREPGQPRHVRAAAPSSHSAAKGTSRRPRSISVASTARSGWSCGSRRCRSSRWIAAIRQPDDERQAGPGLVHRAHLHVDQAGREAVRPQVVLGQVGRNTGGLLRPGDPEPSGLGEPGAKRSEPARNRAASGQKQRITSYGPRVGVLAPSGSGSVNPSGGAPSIRTRLPGFTPSFASSVLPE